MKPDPPEGSVLAGTKAHGPRTAVLGVVFNYLSKISLKGPSIFNCLEDSSFGITVDIIKHPVHRNFINQLIKDFSRCIPHTLVFLWVT